jgi:cell division protein FtsB
LTPLALLNLSEKALVTQNTYRIERMKQTLETVRASQEKLRTEITFLKTPERIQKVATGKLSMVTPTEITFISLPAGEESISYARLTSKEVR